MNMANCSMHFDTICLSNKPGASSLKYFMCSLRKLKLLMVRGVRTRLLAALRQEKQNISQTFSYWACNATKICSSNIKRSDIQTHVGSSLTFGMYCKLARYVLSSVMKIMRIVSHLSTVSECHLQKSLKTAVQHWRYVHQRISILGNYRGSKTGVHKHSQMACILKVPVLTQFLLNFHLALTFFLICK
jgi:hypothetical protein